MPNAKQLNLPLVGKVSEDKGKHFTLATIEGPTHEALQRSVEKYLRDFSPAGYATRVLKEPEEGEDGLWRMTLSRYSSCD